MNGSQHLLGSGVAGVDVENDLADGDGLEQKIRLGVNVDGPGQCLDGLGVVAQLAQAFAQLQGPKGIVLSLLDGSE
jgi:hypothetical protein